MCMHIYSPTLPDHMFHILCIHDIHHNSPLSTLVRDRFGFIITICYTSVSTEFIFFHWEYLYCSLSRLKPEYIKECHMRV
jgi:hypothetical protein